ncbi:hypothetical protein [Algicola sagamiensis]|uniref:hypothetical protein n=1 Tax=Algicola sagamiensis TaxID=163869 RepID=UPI000366EB81|nr:hypothetical protein [Algicola sagamiensis]
MTTENSNMLAPAPAYGDGRNMEYLKDQAISILQKVTGDSWTDHNLPDPGITFIEVLAFVIADLGYRLSFPMTDLLAPNPENEDDKARTPFFMSSALLPSNPVTTADHRRMLMDVPGVRNVFLNWKKQQVKPSEEAELVQVLTGCCHVQVDLEPGADKASVYQNIRNRFLDSRNVNEDLLTIHAFHKQTIGVNLHLSFSEIENIPETISELYFQIYQEVCPPVPRYTYDELEAQSIHRDQIFEGPMLENGLIKEDDVDAILVPDYIYASDVLARIESIKGLEKVLSFKFRKYAVDDDTTGSDEDFRWRVLINPSDEENQEVPDPVRDEDALHKKVAQLDYIFGLLTPDSISHFKHGFLKPGRLDIEIGGQTHILTEEEIDSICSRLKEKVEASINTSSELPGHITEYISGRYRHLSQYLSIQHEFPTLYKLAERRLDGVIEGNELAQIIQFKGFLSLFDQVLADEFAQLEQLKVMLALPEKQDFHRLGMIYEKMLSGIGLLEKDVDLFWLGINQLPLTKRSQPILDISGTKNLLGQYFGQYEAEGFQSIAEPLFSTNQLDRLKRSCNHLVSRFAEQSVDANILKYFTLFQKYIGTLKNSRFEIQQENDDILLEKIVCLKQVIDQVMTLWDYPKISQFRSGGFNYLRPNPQVNQLCHLSLRIQRQLGIFTPGRMPLSTNNYEGFYLLESELIRHRKLQDEEPDAPPSFDPVEIPTAILPNHIYFVVPNWIARRKQSHFSEYMQETMLQQSPVHQSVRVLSLEREQMNSFELLFYAWLNAMTHRPLFNVPASDRERFQLERIEELSELLRQFCKDPSTIDSVPEKLAAIRARNAIGHATINQNFHVAFEQIESLKATYPISQATIQPQCPDTPIAKPFTVKVQNPL